MKTQAWFFCFLLSLVFTIYACKQDKIDPVPPKETITEYIVIPPDLESPTIKKGYYGRHLQWKRVPIPSNVTAVPSHGYGEFFPVTNQLYVFPPLTTSQLKSAYSLRPYLYYIDKIRQKPLYIITPNNKGFYQIDLPKGLYTAFMKADDTNLYGTQHIDGYDHVMPLIINTEQLVERDFLLDIDKYR